MAHWRALGEMQSSWGRGRLHDSRAGTGRFRQALAAYADTGSKVFAGFYHGLLAQLEADTVGADGALTQIDDALAVAGQVNDHCDLAFLHRLRGDILLKRDPGNPKLVEEAYRTAIAIAKEQGARSPVLLASLALAKLYQSTGRSADAHAALAPALEGFAPTPEMPEIDEAQVLLAALAETDEVKAAEAHRQQRVHLQTAYGQAMMWAKGFSVDETKAAFARATALTAKTDNFADRFATAHFQWTLNFLRGELRSARELESSFLKEAEDTGRVVEAGVAPGVSPWRATRPAISSRPGSIANGRSRSANPTTSGKPRNGSTTLLDRS